MGQTIDAQALSKTYKEGSVEVHAVRDVDFQAFEGELIGLFGPSGSGKTTLLSLLGCILHPTSGHLRIFGTDITSVRESKMPLIRRQFVSFIFQGFNLVPALTVQENIELVYELKRVAQRKRTKVYELMERVGLTD
ncbi:MAG TPA: ATP-binding cassette domain-containing protein, partial [Dissulfurispiraceae bacterium]|nr:ATP-binding cassette domain-containing protein [Dissulfurispiraceae bacterium]